MDDDAGDRELIEAEFSRDGFVFRAVKDGLEAMDYLEGEGKFANRKEFPVPDVILLDLKMPTVDGFEFLKWRRLASDNICAIPVVVVSAFGSPEQVTRAYKLGANGFMAKPVQFGTFQKHLKAMGIFWSELMVTPSIA